ncbi:hypothetical protein BKA93DRAFT_764320 [Sparassis latifolia]
MRPLFWQTCCSPRARHVDYAEEEGDGGRSYLVYGVALPRAKQVKLLGLRSTPDRSRMRCSRRGGPPNPLSCEVQPGVQSSPRFVQDCSQWTLPATCTSYPAPSNMTQLAQQLRPVLVLRWLIGTTGRKHRTSEARFVLCSEKFPSISVGSSADVALDVSGDHQA